MTAPTFASPNIGNYMIGRGYAQSKLPTETEWVDMGNLVSFEFEPKVTMEPHFSSRQGVQKKDFVTPTRLEGTLNMSLDEVTARNLGFYMLGLPADSGSVEIDMFKDPAIYLGIRFINTNVVGPTWIHVFPNCLLTPAKAMSLIPPGSGTWQTLDLQADVLYDQATGKFAFSQSSSFT